MTNEEQKLREFAEKWCLKVIEVMKGDDYIMHDLDGCLSDLTALISEGYVSKIEHTKVVQQRDELRERCEQLEFMIEKGLGWDDIKNDITMPHEL